MSDTGQNIATGVTVAGLGIIATKLDINFTIGILIFFSVMHSIIILHYSRKLDFVFDTKDFILSSIIAFALGIVAMFLGVWQNFPEIQIYIAISLACLVGIKVMDIATFYIKRKYGVSVKVDELFDNERKGKKG